MANGWSPERRERQAALIQNWKPWECSTGPRTAGGKATSALNSGKHGLRSRRFLEEAWNLHEIIRICKGTSGRRRGMQVDDAGRPVGNAGLALAFGTTEAAVASILLNSLINAACDGTPGHPPSEQDVNGVLAAVHGIRADDEVEAMLAVQMVSTHFAATRALSHNAVRAA